MSKRPSPHLEAEVPKSERRKRVKSGAACTQCRKNKTRCELPSGPETRCHRCSILTLDCSIANPDLLSAEPPRPMPPVQESSRSYHDYQQSLRPPPLEDIHRPTYQYPYQHQDSPSRLHPHPLRSHPLPPSHHQPRPSVASAAASSSDYGQKSLHQSPAPGERGTTSHSLRPAHHSDPRDSSEHRAPTPPHPWTHPMSTLQAMLRRSPPLSPAPVDGFSVNGDILSQSQIESLSAAFERDFAPWIGLPAVRPTHQPPFWLDNFLTLTRCAVACRLLPHEEFSPVLPQLIRLVEHAVLLKTFNVANGASLEAVEALLILATWLPTIGHTGSEVLHDTTILATWAVKMAQVLKLDEASKQAVNILTRARQKGALAGTEKESYELAMYDARLWVACCNVESRLLAGSSKETISRRSHFDYQALDWQRFSGSGSLQDTRDFRLGIASQIHEVIARGCSIRLRNLQAFKAEVDDVLSSLSEAKNVLCPMQAISPLENVNNAAIMVLQYHGRLLVISHALSQIRAYVAAQKQDAARAGEFERGGSDFVRVWGIDYHAAAQSIVTTFLSIFNSDKGSLPPTPTTRSSSPTGEPTSHPFASAPDIVFVAVLLAATSMIVARYVIVHQFKNHKRLFIETADTMLTRLVDALDAIAADDEHVPRRAATMALRLQGLWRSTTVKPILGSLTADGRERAGQEEAEPVVEGRSVRVPAIPEWVEGFVSSFSGDADFSSVPNLAFEAASNAGIWGDVPGLEAFWLDFVENAEIPRRSA